MYISTRGCYALMALAHMVRSQNAAEGTANQPVSLTDISERLSISISYLEQIFAALRKDDVVRSVRGPGGGYVLSRTAQELSVADILTAVSPSLEERMAATGIGGHNQQDILSTPCWQLWGALGSHIESFTRSITLDDVVQGRVAEKTTPCKAQAS